MAGESARAGTLILDCEAFSKLVLLDREVVAFITAAENRDARVVCSSATLIEAQHGRVKKAAFDFARSNVVVEPVSEQIALQAVELLRQAGLHGHRHAIDAMVAATAFSQVPPLTMLTSDVNDMNKLCDGRVQVISV